MSVQRTDHLYAPELPSDGRKKNVEIPSRNIVVHEKTECADDSMVVWWRTERVMRVKRWESKILRLTFRPKMKAGEDWVDQEEDFKGDERQVEEDAFADDG